MKPDRCLLGIRVLAVWGSAVEAQVVRQLTDSKTTTANYIASLDDAGTTAFLSASADLGGLNPDHRFQVARFNAATGAGTLVTDLDRGIADATYYHIPVSASDDGQWVAFISRSDPLGTNHDAGSELFVVRSDGTQLAQLTNDPHLTGGSVRTLAMAGSGNRIAFVSTSDLLGTNPGRLMQVFAVNRDGTALTQLTQLAEGEVDYLTISDDGQRAAFTADADPTGGNPDLSYEVFAVNGDGTDLRQLTSTTGGDAYAV
jgi:Tol biopolymer transport system component